MDLMQEQQEIRRVASLLSQLGHIQDSEASRASVYQYEDMTQKFKRVRKTRVTNRREK